VDDDEVKEAVHESFVIKQKEAVRESIVIKQKEAVRESFVIKQKEAVRESFVIKQKLFFTVTSRSLKIAGLHGSRRKEIILKSNCLLMSVK
jgi:alkyl hydroperoxide reductase subunit AhpC